MNNNLDMKLSVGRILLKFPLDLAVENIYLGQTEKDTLLYADVIQVNVALTELLKKEIEVTIGTRNMKNVFTVPEELQQIINEYTKGKDPEAYLILGHSSSNKPVSREQAYRVLRSAGHKIGLNSIGAQTMRKTYAWNYYKETGDIYHLQKLFNHASPSITYRFIGEKPNIEVFLKKMTPQENERSRYLLYLNDNGKKKLNKIIDTLTGIRDNFDSPANNDAFYGKVDCLLQELEALMENYQNTK